MSIHWWRSWHGAPTDHKWQVIAVRSGVKVGIVSAVAWALMDYASEHPDRGTVDGFDTELYAVYSGFDETEVTAVIQAMNDKGVIVNGKFANWEKRQPKREDDSTERVREYRAKKRDVTQGNSPEKEREEETETETEREAEDDATFGANPLSVAFEKASGIMPHSLEKWTRTLDELSAMGVVSEDITLAVEELRDKGYAMVGVWSAKNAAISCMGKRKNPGRGRQPNGGRAPIEGV